jgi:probable rRNA maturation factor
VHASMADDDQPPLIALGGPGGSRSEPGWASGSPPVIMLDDRQDADVDLERLMTLARATLIGEGIGDAELSISLVTEEEIAELHERYLHEAGPTDVLSFPLDDEAGEDGLRQLGDVVIAPSVAARNNPDDPAAEVRLLLVHGILHLLGHDHMEQAERDWMWARQERYSGIHVP